MTLPVVLVMLLATLGALELLRRSARAAITICELEVRDGRIDVTHGGVAPHLLARPRVSHAKDIPATSTSGYLEPFRSRVLPRDVRRLGDAFGLTTVGVNHVTIFPGKESSMRHHHTHEDELVYMLEGELVLRTNHGAETLSPGMVVAFRAGDGNGHQLVNRSKSNAVFLVMSNRHSDDGTTYPDDDLELKKVDGRYVFSCKSDG